MLQITQPSMLTVLISIGMGLGVWIIQKYLLPILNNKISSFLESKDFIVQAEVLRQYNNPIRHVLFLTGIYISISYLLQMNIWKIELFQKIYQSFIIAFFIIGIYHTLSHYAKNPSEWKLFNKEQMNEAIFPFLCRLGKVAVIFIGFTIISSLWGYNMNGFIAGLGIGGIALALGAKDVLSDLFGGMSVVLDKPFSIGDIISTEDNRLHGIVEDVNFRSTRLQTFNKERIYVPNSLLSNQPIYNYSRRDKRRMKFHLCLAPETSEEKMKVVMEKILGALMVHEGVDHENCIVFFDEYTPVSNNVLVRYYTNTSDYAEAMKIKEDINFSIMNILKEEDVLLSDANQNFIYHHKE